MRIYTKSFKKKQKSGWYVVKIYVFGLVVEYSLDRTYILYNLQVCIMSINIPIITNTKVDSEA